ncbi:MAG: Asp-tRNA(Asn)/Glu-tRNA(Gln) amidotransferase subunit GatB [Rubrivivax sp.]|nr:Asp-tRNA(Asn)/Glu-tRNA(Gln) amidotransferase subunit GatB [Rubrivivax sp.]
MNTKVTKGAAPASAAAAAGPALVRGWEVVIGLETHAQLSTASKIFSGASTAFGAEPNTQACALDLALPGTLPVPNRGAVERAIRFGLAVGAKVAPMSIFARKNYFYPDLPKGYQISQYEIPVVQGGTMSFVVGGGSNGAGTTKTVRLTRAHLEEDAGKSLHEDYHGMSGIDLNRAGTPLLEIVSEPDMRGAAEAVEYAKALHTLVVWLGICDGNMQEGSFRCDANVSVRRPGTPFGTRREIKNLNSFRFLQQAIDAEVQWQIERLEDGLAIEQATVLFDPDTGETRAMRTKEDAHDYRYFPDPDLPPLVIAPEWVERVRAGLPELPAAMAERFQHDDGLPAYDAAMMTQSLAFARFYEAVRDASGQPKLAANWLMGEVSKRLNAEGLTIERMPLGAALLAALIRRVADGTVSNNSARQVFDALWAATQVGHVGLAAERDEALALATAQVDQQIEKLGLKQMNDTGALEAIVDEVIAANAKSVQEFLAGKDKAFNALVGQVMKASKGKANPAQAGELLRKRLGAT